jgi:DNA topoisomerase I
MTVIERIQSQGILRNGTKERGFRYRHADGRPASAGELERIRELKIPPAWSDVAIHPSAGARVQAVGRDSAGRWQYLYHEAHVARRERQKEARLVRFIDALPRMRRAVERDLALPGIPRAKVLAGILRVLATCFLRPGSEDYADQNGSFGIATLRRRHVNVQGDRVLFDFEGKSGKRQVRELTDRSVAALVRRLLRYPGEVFKFQAEDGSLVDVRRKHINAYLKEVMGEQFSAKDFRTWAGSLLCASALAREGAEPGKLTKHRIAAALREVAGHLGNTPAVCRSSYVSPTVLRRFTEGRVIRAHVQDVSELMKGSVRKIERSERALAELLRGTKNGSALSRGT